MFKSSWSSYLFPSWSTSSQTTKNQSVVVNNKDSSLNSNSNSFTIKSNSSESSPANLYNISMSDSSNDDEFVDITYKKLSYAEVAALSQNKKQVTKLSKPKQNRVNSNQYQVLSIDESKDNKTNKNELDDELEQANYLEEKFKTNNYFRKNKQYKSNDKKKLKQPSGKKLIK